MHWKFIAALAVAVALLPSMAQAANSPELTYPTGTRLATGSGIRGVNVGETKLTSASSTVTCSSASIEGTLKTNSGTTVEADIEGVSLTGGEEKTCSSATSPDVAVNPETSKNGTPWCLRSTPELAEDEFQVRGGKCSEATRSIRLAVIMPTALTECVYQRSGAIVGTYKTSPEDALLTASEVEYSKQSGSITCPATTKLDTSVTLVKDEVTTNPLYLSAGPLLTFPIGTVLPVGTKFRGQNVGEMRVTSTLGTTVSCSALEMTGTLKKNNGTEVEADIEKESFSGTGTAESCTTSTGDVAWSFNSGTNGVPWCLRATSKMAADEFQIRGNNCASASRAIRFVYQTLTSTECLYERSAALTGTVTTHPEDAVLKFTNATFLEIEPKAACPDETTLDSSLTLERKEAGTHPMYVS